MTTHCKRLLALLLALTLLFCLAACNTGDKDPEGETDTTANTADPTDTDDTDDTDDTPKKEDVPSDTPSPSDKEDKDPVNPTTTSLDGKKIIFIGNSYTYYGQTVLEKSQKYLTQASRVNDKGYFYQLCKANGMNVNVTNWTFGGHSLAHLFDGNCSANRGCDGEDHKAYLTDANYDYVVLQTGSSEAADMSFLDHVETITAFFRAANPNVKFVILVPYNAYGTIGGTICLSKKTLNSLKALAADGVTVVDWGGLVMDILDGKVTVPGGTCDYVKNTFVVCKSAKDGYHPSQLSGYITTLMTYSALTGASAVGQPYDFCNNSSLRPAGGSAKFYSFDEFIEDYYTYNNATTNYPDVFASKTDMAGIQTLIDAHLAAGAYLTYNYTDGTENTPNSDAEAIAAGKVAKVANGGTETYLTKDELQSKLKNGYTNGDHITLLTDVSCEGTYSDTNMKKDNMSVTFDLNAKTLTLTKGSLVRTSSSQVAYKNTFHLLSSNGKGTLTVASGNSHSTFVLYGNNKTLVIGSREGYTDGDCVEINAGKLIHAVTAKDCDASTTAVTMYGGAINRHLAISGACISLYEAYKEGYTNSYYMGQVNLIGTTLRQTVETTEPFFRITRSDASMPAPETYGNAPGITLTDCTVTGYSATAKLHDMETLNAKITYNNCQIVGDVSDIGTDTSDTGLGKVILGAGTELALTDATVVRAYDATALTTYEASASGIYLAENTTLTQITGGYRVTQTA